MKRLFYLTIILLIASCSPTNMITVTNVHDMTSFVENSYIYALPRTKLKISVIALRHKTVPGPYNKYAEKFLGIVNAPSVPEILWEIADIQMHVLHEADPDYFFSVQAPENSPTIDQLLKMGRNGLIISPDAANPFVQFHGEDLVKPEAIPFTDLSVKRNFYTEIRKSKPKSGTNKVNVPTDLPMKRSEQGQKTIEDKAEEAANFIIKIRKRRFKLLAGQYKVFPEGQALKTSVNQLNKLEKEYLSLFIGKTYTDTVRQDFYFVPSIGNDLERKVICRFSNQNGFEDASSNNGKPLVLELKSAGLTSALEHLQLPEAGPNYHNTLFYRIPDMASTHLFYGSLPVLEVEVKVYQYGSIVPFCVNNKRSK